MTRRKKKQPAGAPLWVMTYGDLMSLILVFFILLAAFSEIRKEDEWEVIAEVIKESFGLRGGGGFFPTDRDPQLSMQQRLEHLQVRAMTDREVSNADDPGMTGRHPEVTRVREGWKFVVGGRISFAPDSADLDGEAMEELARIAELMRGYNNKIEVRGHASSREALAGSDFDNLMDLSYVRARNVEHFLLSEEGGAIRPERIRVVAAGDREPLVRRQYDDDRHTGNRRVEVLVMEAVAKDLSRPELDP